MSETETCICTVLLISYNHAPYISEAIDSVLAQKTKYKYKISIFDDASTDGTIDIIRQYVAKYPDLITAHISEKNQGAQTNIWNAYSSVDTKYCILLECDDYWCDEKKLELQLDAMESHPDCSFCGHNTRCYTLTEECREYENDSVICQQPILARKRIFTIDDFWNITNGGYIPYVSSRLIRSECMKLNEIVYKESFLFDHTQFYYLLLKGKYYYIDRVMTVYRRTGKGTCSEKRPLEFLNIFLQNSLDFNRQTNYVIANKIFSDCILQIQFRMKLETNFMARNIESAARKEYINIVSPIALGDTMILAGFKKEMERIYKAPIFFLIKPQYAAVMELYGIKDYQVIEHMDEINFDLVKNKSDIPKRGNLFIGHPIFYPEYQKMYESLRDKLLDIDFLTYFRKFLGLPETAEFEFPKYIPPLSDSIRDLIGNLPLDRIVLLFPEAVSCQQQTSGFWQKKVDELIKEGYTVFVNSSENFNLKRTKNIYLSVADTIALASRCHSVLAIRSGMCDLMMPFCRDLTVFYPSHADLFIFGLKAMYGEKAQYVTEKLALMHHPYQIVSEPSKRKAYLLGMVPIPECVYHFYLKHKKWLQKYKRIVRWK